MQTAQFIELLKAVFLGIVEGITEWLPISSTGHLILVNEFLNLRQSKDFIDMFIVIQLGCYSCSYGHLLPNTWSLPAW